MNTTARNTYRKLRSVYGLRSSEIARTRVAGAEASYDGTPDARQRLLTAAAGLSYAEFLCVVEKYSLIAPEPRPLRVVAHQAPPAISKPSCPNPACPDYGRVDAGNLIRHGQDKRKSWMWRYQCETCGRHFRA